jgi:hypothetical protein
VAKEKKKSYIKEIRRLLRKGELTIIHLPFGFVERVKERLSLPEEFECISWWEDMLRFGYVDESGPWPSDLYPLTDEELIELDDLGLIRTDFRERTW